MSISLSMIEAQRLADLLSRERLKWLIDIGGDDATAVDLHQQILQLNAGLIKIVATIEIALRNVTNEILTRHFAYEDWLQRTPVNFVWDEPERMKVRMAIDSAKRSEYAKLGQHQKNALKAAAFPTGRPASHREFVEGKRAPIPVGQGKVIAELNLNFWKSLYGARYEHHLWKPALKRAFPNKTLKRSIVSANLEAIYQTRNRLAHHEPVVGARFRATMVALEFVCRELGSDGSSGHNPLQTLLEADMTSIRAKETELSSRLARPPAPAD